MGIVSFDVQILRFGKKRKRFSLNFSKNYYQNRYIDPIIKSFM